MTKSNISKRKTQLEADGNGFSNKYVDTEEIFTYLRLLPLKQGSKKSREHLDFMNAFVPQWLAQSPVQKMLFIDHELSRRKENIEKRIYSLLEFYIHNVGISIIDLTQEQYDTTIEKLHGFIEDERESPLVNPPLKGKGTWLVWLKNFMSYVVLTRYNWEDVEVEFLKEYTRYPQQFLEIWREKPQNILEGFRSLHNLCLLLDKIEQKEHQNNDSKKKNVSSRLTCRLCGIVGHIAKNCRRTSNKDGRSNTSYEGNNYGNNFTRKRKFDGYNNAKKNFQKDSNI
ncbi:hypothetical protein NEAUS03_0020 [Nematocida ausubeli]|nr:hypothetical protein NEAUS03_0020 [Nematocida ausubeli]